MSKEILRLHQPVNLSGSFGFIGKGDYEIGKGDGAVDPAILKHWLIKGMLNDGLAVIIRKGDADEKPKTAEVPKQGGEKSKRGGRGNKTNTPDSDDNENPETDDIKDNDSKEDEAKDGNAKEDEVKTGE